MKAADQAPILQQTVKMQTVKPQPAPVMPAAESAGGQVKEPSKADLKPVEIILDMISKDPFLSISEIKTEINRKYPKFKFGWWQIWNILRSEKLLSRKNRFRRARVKAGGL